MGAIPYRAPGLEYTPPTPEKRIMEFRVQNLCATANDVIALCVAYGLYTNT